MEKLTVNSKIQELFLHPGVSEYAQYLIYSNPAAAQQDMSAFAQQPLSILKNIGWSPEGVAAGFNFFLDEISSGRVEQYFIYNDEESKTTQKRYVNLIRLLPEKPVPDTDTIILCAGGGYGSVCTVVEALPTARHFSENGYTVYILSYRVSEDCIAPKALEDLANAVKYLQDNANALGVDPERLVIGGYSAGANLISNFGVPTLGYKKYGLVKPKALIPVYTFINLSNLTNPDLAPMLKSMFGDSFEELSREYNVAERIDKDYPPCYIVCGEDDTTVGAADSALMKERLDAAVVPAVLHTGPHAPHGFGDGTGTDVEGWPEKAMEFIKAL